MIKYRKGYKYQLAQTFMISTPIRPKEVIELDFIQLEADGHLTIKRGYAWDGASGPTFDTKNTMEPSLVHDVFCQLIRNGYLYNEVRAEADQFFYEHLRRNGMWKLRAWIWYRGVRIGAQKNLQVPKTVFIALLVLLLSSCSRITVQTDSGWNVTYRTLWRDIEEVDVKIGDATLTLGSASSEITNLEIACALAPRLCE